MTKSQKRRQRRKVGTQQRSHQEQSNTHVPGYNANFVSSFTTTAERKTNTLGHSAAHTRTGVPFIHNLPPPMRLGKLPESRPRLIALPEAQFVDKKGIF